MNELALHSRHAIRGHGRPGQWNAHSSTGWAAHAQLAEHGPGQPMARRLAAPAILCHSFAVCMVVQHHLQLCVSCNINTAHHASSSLMAYFYSTHIRGTPVLPSPLACNHSHVHRECHAPACPTTHGGALHAALETLHATPETHSALASCS